MTPLILVVSGPGGVGKGTVVERLVGADARLWLSRSWTTRPRRAGERPDAYVFVDQPTFEARIAGGGFIEWTAFAGNGYLYGTPTPEPPDGSDVVLEIDLDGARQVRERYPEAVVILLVAPSVEIQRQRLRDRGDSAGEVEARVRVGAEEETAGRSWADHVVVNDDVTRAVAELAGIVDEHRADPPR